VHAVADTLPVTHRGQKAGCLAMRAQTAERIEDAYLYVLEGGEGEEKLVLAAGVKVVDQQPRPYTALGNIAQRAQQPRPVSSFSRG